MLLFDKFSNSNKILILSGKQSFWLKTSRKTEKLSDRVQREVLSMNISNNLTALQAFSFFKKTRRVQVCIWLYNGL